MDRWYFGEEFFIWIQKFSRIPLAELRTTVPLSKLKKGGKEGEEDLLHQGFMCETLSVFVVGFFLFVNSPHEQRQGLAVLSSTRPWLSSKNRANHHDGHTNKRKENQTTTASLDCLTLPSVTLKPAQIHCYWYHAWAKDCYWCCA